MGARGSEAGGAGAISTAVALACLGVSAGVTTGAGVAGCGADDAPPVPNDGVVSLRFVADPSAVGEEAYLCFGFDPAPLVGRAVTGIAVTPPAEPSAVMLHHVALYAVQGPFGDGPVPCETMPEGALELDVWAPGGAPLTLPPGVALEPPETTERLVVQAHAARHAVGAAGVAEVTLTLALEPPAVRAAWLRAPAPVPAIRPHTTETSTALCRVAGELHVFSTWPHMHRTGAEFHGAVVDAAGARAPLVDVVPWVFEEQRAYAAGVTLAPGSAIETTCVWRNEGDEYVLPGPGVNDEMCAQSLIVWPAEAAACLP